MRGCGADAKCEEIGRLFTRRRMDVMALSETKLKGVGEVRFGEVLGRKSGVSERVRAKEGVALIVRKELMECVREWSEVSSRIMWVRMKIGHEKWVFVSTYGPGSEHTEQEVDGFWDELRGCLHQFGEDEYVVVMGDLNARVGSRKVEGVVGCFGIDGRNESGEKMIYMCTECGMTIGNTMFKKRSVHKYTWERRRREEIVDRALMDYVLVSGNGRSKLLDVNVLRGESAGMSDHYLVEGKMRVNPNWKKRQVAEGTKEMIRTGELEDVMKVGEYRGKINDKWSEVRNTPERGVEQEWHDFRDAVMECATEVCGKRRVGGKGIRKGSEWWNNDVEKVVKEKRRLFERSLQSGRVDDWERYKNKRQEVKRVIKEAKKAADERWGERMSEKFEDRKKMFWKEVKRVRRGDEKREVRVRDERGQILVENEQVKGRWAEYFEALLNVRDERGAELVAVGDGRRMPMMNGRDREIEKEEVERAISRMKEGKAPGMDGIAAECIKKGGVSVVEWLVRLFSVCFVLGVAPLEWRSACIVPLYKGKGDSCECGSYRGISLLAVVGKLYGRVLIERVVEMTEVAVGEEQCGFRRGRGCVDQIFAVRQICEKFRAKGREVFVAFMDLEKAYDRIDREALWKVMGMYGIGGKLLTAVKSFYMESRACVRVGDGESEWFAVEVGLRQGCVMSPWLFNIFIDGVVREMKVRTLGNGVDMVGVNGEIWQVNQLLFADDTVLMADSEEKLQRVVKEFGRVCKRRKLKINVSKSKVMVCNRGAQGRNLDVWVEGERLEEVADFKYLGGVVAGDASTGIDIQQRVNDGMKVFGAVKSMWNVRSLSMKGKRAMYQGIVVPTALYGAETWGASVRDRKRLDVMEMKCLRSMCGVTRRDRVRNEEVHRRVGVHGTLSERMDKRVLSWFGHVERMEENRLTKRVYKSSAEGVRGRGRPKLGWMDGVKRAVEERGVNVDGAKELACDRSEWRAFVNS